MKELRDSPAHAMTTDTANATSGHALKLALLYLTIRGLPELAAWAWVMLPESIRFGLMEGQWAGAVLLLPPQPMGLFHAVPMSFQYLLSSWSVLVIEVLLVFLASAWYLRRRPVDGKARPAARAWLVMALATLAWSVVLRYLVLGFLVDRQLAQLDSGLAFDELYGYIFRSYWLTVPVFYASTVLWALLPVWLHFRTLGRPLGVTADGPHMVALKRASVAGGFFLGFTLLHYLLLQLVLGLWAWAVTARDIYIPTEELQRLGLPLVFSQILAPTVACAVAAWLYSRHAQWRSGSAFQLVIGPVLAGGAVLALVNLICLTLLWLLYYVDYGLVSGILLGVAYRPEAGAALLVAFNAFSLILLCVLTIALRGPRGTPAAYSARS